MPVVACHVPNPKQRALDAGALDYLTKPVDRTQLAAVLAGVPRLRSVLVVDDELESARLMARLIEACVPDVVVTTETDSRAVGVTAGGARPDLILLDVVMPWADGWHVLAELKSAPDLVDIPVVMVSAQDPDVAPPATSFLHVAAIGGVPVGALLPTALQLTERLIGGRDVFVDGNPTTRPGD